MQFATNHYSLGQNPVTGAGLGTSDAALAAGLAGAVQEIVYDEAGTNLASDLLASVPETDFERGRLEEILNSSSPPEDWRVGEAIAESYLVANSACQFPWPDGRDERKRGSSLPGADLVGFKSGKNGIRFAFGEVKTSYDPKNPPGVVYGRHGLKKQLEDLRDNRQIRDDLVKYLAHRAASSDWEADFKSATSAYLGDPTNVCLFGILVRDVPPSKDDLRARVESLSRGCPPASIIELLALHLPKGSIKN